MEKLSVLFISGRLIPSNIIGIIKPMLALQREQEIEFQMRYIFNYKEKDIEWADTVILCRSLDIEYLTIIKLVQKYNKRLIYDIDDNFFELSIQTELGKYHRYPPHLLTVREIIKYSDAVRVYSKPMEENVSQWNENTYRLKSYFDFSLIKNVKKEDHEKIRIVYASGRGNADPLAQLCLPAVTKILMEYPDSTELYIFGKTPKYMNQVKKNIRQLKFIPDYNKYIRFSYAKNFDIGLAPLLDDRYHNSKTNNKYREYGAMGICGIYSNAQIYRDCIQNEENGILVSNTTDAWYKAIKTLVEDSKLRERIRKDAYSNVKSEYAMENTLEDWRMILSVKKVSKPAFRNFLDVNISVLHDEKEKGNFRIQQLTHLLNYAQLDYKYDSFQSADLWKLQKRDVCICFASKDSQVDQWIATLHNYGVNNIVMDTLFPCDKCGTYPDVLFTNPDKQYENSVFIPDLYGLESVNLEQTTKQVLAMPGNELSFHELYRSGKENINTIENEVFSLRNPSIFWADVISRYDFNNKKKKNAFIAMMQNIWRKTVKFRRLITIIWKIASIPLRWIYRLYCYFADRISWSIACSHGYWKVNKAKKY